jgi:hypothetical protein
MQTARTTLRAFVIVVCTSTIGCAPMATFRPISAFAGGQASMEMGLGTVAVSPRPYVDERWSHTGTAWFTAQVKPWLQLSGISAFDDGALGVGVGATALLFRRSWFMAGVEAEAGYGWAAAGVPIAARLFEQTYTAYLPAGAWIYAQPHVTNFGIYPSVGTPIGLSVHIQKGAFVRLEYQASWEQFQRYNLRHHLGAAFAVQW